MISGYYVSWMLPRVPQGHLMKIGSATRQSINMFLTICSLFPQGHKSLTKTNNGAGTRALISAHVSHVLIRAEIPITELLLWG